MHGLRSCYRPRRSPEPTVQTSSEIPSDTDFPHAHRGLSELPSCEHVFAEHSHAYHADGMLTTPRHAGATRYHSKLAGAPSRSGCNAAICSMKSSNINRATAVWCYRPMATPCAMIFYPPQYHDAMTHIHDHDRSCSLIFAAFVLSLSDLYNCHPCVPRVAAHGENP